MNDDLKKLTIILSIVFFPFEAMFILGLLSAGNNLIGMYTLSVYEKNNPICFREIIDIEQRATTTTEIITKIKALNCPEL